MGLTRLVHPFPSLLNGAVVAVVALIASGDPGAAVRLAGAMVLLQFAIGAFNDVVDEPRDAGRKPGKPIPAGLVTPRLARLVGGAAAAGGLLLALASGAGVLAVAVAGLVVGLAYDLRLRGTPWSWLPLAVGIPLVPVFGWFGSTGALPPVFLVLVPIAALEGAALALANALVDLERDRDAGVQSVALVLGPTPAATAGIVLQVLVGVLAIGAALVAGAPGGWLGAAAVTAAVPVSGALLGLVAAVRRPGLRETAWEVQAVGAGVLAVAWLGSLSAAGTFDVPTGG